MRDRILLAAILLTSLLSAQAARNPQFRAWDKNQDGFLVPDELPEPVRRNFGRVDTDGDGRISVKEHESFLQRRRSVRRQPQQVGIGPRYKNAIVSHLDLPYADDDNPRHRLDLFLPKEPKGDGPLPLVIYIHGGGWQNGTKDGGGRRVAEFVASGNYAGASIGYRLTGEAKWPAQIHDCKAAIRWLKANAAKYNIDPERIAVWGTSAGAHLASMLGLSNGDEELEGTLGKCLDQDSRVVCVLDWYGPSDLFTIHEQRGAVRRESPEMRLIGGYAKDVPEMGRSVSPVHHVTAKAPPFLIAHGDKDGTVPFAQSEELVEAMKKAGVDPEPVFLRFAGGGHGQGIGGEELTKTMGAFLDMHLRGIKTELKSATLPAEPVRRR